MKILAVVNEKGGVGKTHTVINVGHYTASVERRTLVADIDPQGNTSRTLKEFSLPGIDSSRLFDSQPIELPAAGGNLALLGSDRKALRDVERSTMSDGELVANLRARLAELAPYFDYVVIDTQGSNSRIANAVLAACDFALIPCKVDQHSIDVSVEVFKRVNALRLHYKLKVVNLGIMINEFDPRQPEQVKISEQLQTKYAAAMFPGIVADRSAYREAISAQVPVWNLRDEHGRIKSAARDAAKEIRGVCQKLLARMEAA
jgi:chromosome partitioning protein